MLRKLWSYGCENNSIALLLYNVKEKKAHFNFMWSPSTKSESPMTAMTVILRRCSPGLLQFTDRIITVASTDDMTQGAAGQQWRTKQTRFHNFLYEKVGDDVQLQLYLQGMMWTATCSDEDTSLCTSTSTPALLNWMCCPWGAEDITHSLCSLLRVWKWFHTYSKRLKHKRSLTHNTSQLLELHLKQTYLDSHQLSYFPVW